MDNTVIKQAVISVEYYEALDNLARTIKPLLVAIHTEHCVHAINEFLDVDECVRYLDLFSQPNTRTFSQMMATAFPNGSDASFLKEEAHHDK